MQKFIEGMLTNFGSLTLDRIHNSLKVKSLIPSISLAYMTDNNLFQVNSINFSYILIFQMFCLAEPPYDKSLQQLQSFLSSLISEEKLEMRDGMYFLKK